MDVNVRGWFEKYIHGTEYFTVEEILGIKLMEGDKFFQYVRLNLRGLSEKLHQSYLIEIKVGIDAFFINGAKAMLKY